MLCVTVGTAATSAATPKKGGTLTALIDAVWPTLDPAGSTITPAEATWEPEFEPLFWTSQTGVESPWLALGAKTTDGGDLITLKLRQGVKFQDGTPFDATAVVFNLERYASPSVASECVAYFADMTSATVVSKYSVAIHLSQPDSGFTSLLGAYQCGLMVSPAAVQSEGANFGNEPVGTGPFKYVGGSPGTLANFTAWKGYWGPKPLLSGVTLEEVGSTQAAFDALQTGQAQFWPVADGVDYQGQARQDGLTVQVRPAYQNYYVSFSLKYGSPFANPLAREAVFYATDTASIIKNLELNIAKPIEGVFPENNFATPAGGKIKGYPTYDLAKAKQLVSEIPGGLSFSLLSSNIPTYITLDEALQAQWEAAGMTVTLDPLAGPAEITLVHNLHFQAINIANPYLPDPDDIAYRWFYSQSPLSQNGLDDPAADKLILSARAATRVSTRTAIYDKLDTRLEDTDFVWDDLFTVPSWGFLNKDVHGLDFSPTSLVHWNQVWMS
jgi:peptide/nickel transport system substrate-binding protein